MDGAAEGKGGVPAVKEDGVMDLEKVGIGDLGSVLAGWQPSCEPAVLLLLPLKFVLPNFSCAWRALKLLMPRPYPRNSNWFRIQPGHQYFFKKLPR